MEDGVVGHSYGRQKVEGREEMRTVFIVERRIYELRVEWSREGHAVDPSWSGGAPESADLGARR
jgi:hypothetical protein